MAKNRPKKWLCLLVDFTNKIFQSIFWLEIWWDVVRHPIAPALRLWWGLLVLAGRHVSWIAKKWSPWFLPHSTPHHKYFNFFVHHSKGKVFTDILYAERLVPARLVWGIWLFEWTQLFFIDYAQMGFPLKRCHNDVTDACNLPQKMRYCRPDPNDTFSDFLAQSF